MCAVLFASLCSFARYHYAVKLVSNGHSKLNFKTNYRLMQIKSKGHSAILLTFIKLPFAVMNFVLSIFALPFYTGFTVASFALY